MRRSGPDHGPRSGTRQDHADDPGRVDDKDEGRVGVAHRPDPGASLLAEHGEQHTYAPGQAEGRDEEGAQGPRIQRSRTPYPRGGDSHRRTFRGEATTADRQDPSVAALGRAGRERPGPKSRPAAPTSPHVEGTISITSSEPKPGLQRLKEFTGGPLPLPSGGAGPPFIPHGIASGRRWAAACRAALADGHHPPRSARYPAGQPGTARPRR